MRSTSTPRAAVALLLAGLVGCGAPAPAVPTRQFPPTPPADPVAGCAAQLEYWAGEELRGAPDEGFDYQHMGLTSGQFDALRAIVAEVVAGGDAAEVPGLAREACARLATDPSSDPWGG